MRRSRFDRALDGANERAVAQHRRRSNAARDRASRVAAHLDAQQLAARARGGGPARKLTCTASTSCSSAIASACRPCPDSVRASAVAVACRGPRSAAPVSHPEYSRVPRVLPSTPTPEYSPRLHGTGRSARRSATRGVHGVPTQAQPLRRNRNGSGTGAAAVSSVRRRGVLHNGYTTHSGHCCFYTRMRAQL